MGAWIFRLFLFQTYLRALQENELMQHARKGIRLQTSESLSAKEKFRYATAIHNKIYNVTREDAEPEHGFPERGNSSNIRVTE